ncbi:TIGR01777 family protein [Idiomarina tyrosinivorans]|uniref:TIGR01777 family protein n=1 Tax=Idiomarina tyrosinivorans TaxID=1445662 RepID=A0A432ZLD4_9GAMM|nr:TIGR01777 family oxidoreductase [Idiomarina tyrosinivorans]RUO78835.1 TIGR01777 family protein [Idiomarina tyrosinivorans]
MKLLMTGGTGLIGRALINRLQHRYHITVITRSPTKAYRLLGHDVHAIRSIDELPSLNDFAAVINLQGEPIADKRWSAKQKQKLQQSRWQITRRLAAMIAQAEAPPDVFLSGSAIGYYGPQQSDVKVTEAEHTTHYDFAHELCAEWEQLAFAAENDHTRICTLRTGVVLAPKGGALKKMLPAYKMGLGGPMGNGQQMMSWVHLDDEVGMIETLLDNDQAQGAYNLTAPEPVSNQVFSETLAEVLGRPHLFKVPAFVLQLMLGEMSSMLLEGQAVYPKRMQQLGYRFRYPQLTEALQACINAR